MREIDEGQVEAIEARLAAGESLRSISADLGIPRTTIARLRAARAPAAEHAPPGEWNFACPDWQDRIKSGRSLLPSLPLDPRRRDAAVELFNLIRLPDVPGRPTMKEACGPWFREIVGALHGSIDASGARRIREIFLLVPKKQGKSTLGAALMLTELILNKRPRAEFLIVAPSHAIALLSFGQIVGMVEANAGFAANIEIQNHLKKITNSKTGAALQVKSFDPAVLTGVRPSGVLIDELHVLDAVSQAGRIIGQLRGGLISQPEGFLAFITTQSERPPAGIFKAELTKARNIRDGVTKSAAMLPVLYEFPESVAWRDPTNWASVTPNLGRSVHLPRLVEEFKTAEETGADELARWSSQHLNIEIGLQLRSDRWAGAEYWEAHGEPGLTLDKILSRSEVVAIGIDGGGLDDLLGVAVIGRDKASGQWLAWAHAFAHEKVLETRKSEAQRLRDFERDGDLTIVSRMDVAFEAVAEIAARVDRAGNLASVGLDVHGIAPIVDALRDRNIEGDARVIGVSQGWKLTGTIKLAEVKLADGGLVHCGSAMMSWCVSNAKVEPKGNAVTITKQTAGTGKIDPLMALFNAVAILAQNPSGGVSVYEAIALRAKAPPIIKDAGADPLAPGGLEASRLWGG
jgi:phage terminase large subunit-like protein